MLRAVQQNSNTKFFSARHKQFKQFDHRAGWMVVNDVFPFLRSNRVLFCKGIENKKSL